MSPSMVHIAAAQKTKRMSLSPPTELLKAPDGSFERYRQRSARAWVRSKLVGVEGSSASVRVEGQPFLERFDEREHRRPVNSTQVIAKDE